MNQSLLRRSLNLACLRNGRIGLFLLILFIILESSLIFAIDREDEIWGHLERGFILLRQGDLDNASREFLEVISIEPDNSYAHHNLGRVYAETGRLDKAIIEFKKAIELKPDFFAPHFRLGVVYRVQGKIEDAIIELRRTLEINPGFQLAMLELGLIQERRGLPEFAVENYLALIEINKDSPEAKEAMKRMGQIGSTPDEAKEVKRLANEANKYLKAGKIDEAISVLNAILDILPRMTFAHHKLGFIYGGTGRIDEAITEFKKAIEGNPRYIPSHFLLGKLYESQGLLKEAVEEYKNVFLLAGIRDDIPEARQAEEKLIILEERVEMLDHLEKGETFFKENDRRSALSEFQSAVSISPENPLSHYNLGLFYSRIERFPLAIYELEESIRLMPAFLQSYLAIGDIYERHHYFFKGMRYYLSILSIDPEKRSKEAREAYNRLLGIGRKIKDARERVRPYLKEIKEVFGKEDTGEVFKRLQGAAVIYPEEPLIHLYRGIIFKEKGKINLAARELKTALELNPDYIDAHYYLGMIYEEHQNYPTAIDEYNSFLIKAQSSKLKTQNSEEEVTKRLRLVEKELDEARERSRIFFDRGIQLSKEGDLEGAIKEFIEALSFEPENPFIHSSLGIAYFMKGNFNDAAGEFNKVIALDPNRFQEHLRLGLIYEREGLIQDARREYMTTLELADKGSKEAKEARERLKEISIIIEKRKKATWHFEKGKMLYNMKRMAMAERELSKATELAPDNYFYHYSLGTLYQAKGDIDKAVEEYKKANLNKGLFDSRYRLAVIYDYKGRLRDAIRVYEEAMNLIKDKDSQEARYIRGRLKILKKRIYASAGYTISYDNNINPSGEEKESDLISNLSSDLTYYLIKRERINLTFRYNIQINEYYISQVFFNNNNTLLDFQHRIWSGFLYTIGYRFQWGIQNKRGLVSYGNNIVGEIKRRGELPTSITLHFDYLDFNSKENSEFNARRKKGQLSIFQQMTPNDQVNIWYTYIDNDVRDEEEAYKADMMGLTYSRRIINNLRANIASSYSLQRSVNPVLGTGLHRRNRYLSYSLGVSYLVGSDFSVSVNYQHLINRSNLGEIFKNLEDIATEQTTSLGSYEKDTITFGANIFF